MFDRNIIQYLEKWKNKKNRKPLVLRGARQVGKTSAVKIFANNNFDNLININLEKSKNLELFRDITSIDEFEKTVDIALQEKIIPGKTLIFLDEIQNTPNLIKFLRFFYEDRPGWHIIATGSLLDVQVEKQGLTMPVGRIEYAYLFPLTFFEFLKAVGENKLLEFLQDIDLKDSIPTGIHNKALNLFHDYALVGGMPEIISLYSQKTSQEDLNSVYSSLITAYNEDIYKYATKANVKYISYTLEQAPYFAGERIAYENFGGSTYKSREMSQAFGTLEKAMLLTQVRATKSTALPIIKQEKRAKKLLYLDVGLVNFKNNIQTEFLRVQDLNDLYRGKIAEQVIGQNLLASSLYQEQSLYYWAKEKPKGSAEVDFCMAVNGKITGIEVKSGHSSRLKSLFSFDLSVKNAVLTRVYSGELKTEEVKYFGQKHKLLSLPFYLINRI